MCKQIFRITAILALFWMTNASATPIDEKFKPLPAPQKIDLSPLNIKGNYDLIIVHFWASWCHNCPAEMEWLNTFAGQLKNEKVLIVALAIDIKDQEELKEYYKKRSLGNLTPIVDETLQVAHDAGVLGVPTTIFVDSKSNIIGKSLGPIKWDNKEFEEWYKTYAKNRN